MTDPSVQAGWYPDPAARFELRYHNGREWTADVSSHGQRYVDPRGTSPPGPIVPPGRRPGNGMGIAAMVLGVVALAVGWLPFVFAIGAVLAILAIVFGSVALRRGRRTGSSTGPAIAGLVTGLVAIPVAALGLLVTIAFVRAFDSYDNPAANDTVITECEKDGGSDLVTARGSITNLSDEAADFSVRVEFVRAGTDNVQSRVRVQVEDVPPGAARPFTATRAIAIDDVECRIGSVDGPLPFGVEIEN